VNEFIFRRVLKIERTGRVGSRRKQLLGELKETKKILEIERGSTRLPSLESSPNKISKVVVVVVVVVMMVVVVVLNYTT
jgi:hypothetical protein